MSPADKSSAALRIPRKLREEWSNLVTPQSRLASRGFGSEPTRNLDSAASDKAAPSTQSEAEPGNGKQIELIRQIQATSEFVVYEAWDHAAQRDVAVKMLAPEARENQAIAAEFWRRARCQAAVDHGNIVSIYNIDQSAGQVITEYCKQAIPTGLPQHGLPEQQVRELLIQVLSALEYLHRQGRVHGELRPSVIMSSTDHVLKLDQLSGREAGSELQLRPGCEKYVAPETLDESRFGVVDVTVDLYALGIIGLELLAGCKFTKFFAGYGLDLDVGGDGWLRWQMSAEARLPSVAELLPKTRPDLASLIDKLLIKRVSDRIGSARQAREMLTKPQVAPNGSAELQLPQTLAAAYVPASQQQPRLSLSRPEGGSIPTPAAPRATAGTGRVTMRDRVDGLFAEQNANKLAGAILLITTFVAGLAFFEAPQADSPTEDELAFQAFEEAPQPPSLAYQPPIIEAAEPEPPPKTDREPRAKPATPPPAQSGQLVITVEPPDAWVRVNGQPYVTAAPLQLSPGRHRIDTGRWGYLKQSQQVHVQAGQSKLVTLNLHQRAVPPSYEPVLLTSHSQAKRADEILKQLLEETWTEAGPTRSLSRIKQEVSERISDPRIIHAIAAVTAVQGKKLQHSLDWYQDAARVAPVPYSWPQKGAIKAWLMLGDTDRALRQSKDFVFAAYDFFQSYAHEPRAERFLIDTANFVGKVIGLIEVISANPHETSLIRQELRSHFSVSAAEMFDSSRQETMARYRETMGARIKDPGKLVRQFLGDSLAEERRALRQSLGKRSTGRTVPSMTVTLQQSASSASRISRNRDRLRNKQSNENYASAFNRQRN